MAITLSGPDTFWIGDALNHNCIIRAMRIANVPGDRRVDLRAQRPRRPRRASSTPCPTASTASSSSSTASSACAATPRRCGEIAATWPPAHDARFRDGVVTMMDDSHGIGAYGATGRGTEEHCGRDGRHPHRHVRQGLRRQRRVRRRQPRADRGGAAEGGHLHLHQPARRGRLRGGGGGRRHRRRRRGPRAAGQPGRADARSSARASTRSASSRSPGPTRWCRCWCAITDKVRAMVQGLFERSILAVGLTFPVVPEGRRDDPLPDQRRAHRGRHRRGAGGAQRIGLGLGLSPKPSCAASSFKVMCLHG